MNPKIPARHRAAWLAAPATALITALAACSSMPGGGGAGAPGATAPLQARSGSQVSGTILFGTQVGGLRVVARVTGLKPGQEHGFHIHEKGDCSAPDAMSAGGHFNPTAQPHGPQGMPHHGGDMPSLKADAMGNAEATFTVEGVSLTGPSDGVIGKAVVVHAMPDDYKTQPTGNSGGRIACGVIGATAAAR